MDLSRLTSNEIAETNKDIIILPIGSMEQHGPFLPVSTDTIIVKKIAEEIGNKLNVPVLPALEFSLSEEHSGFPGTIFITEETFSRVIHEVYSCVKKFGFKKLVILNAHGGNDRVLLSLKDQICDLHLINLWEIYPKMINQVHADKIETSIILAIDKKLVRQERIIDETPKAALDQLKKVGMKNLSNSGVWGNPSKASKKEGEKLLGHCLKKVRRYLISRAMTKDLGI